MTALSFPQSIHHPQWHTMGKCIQPQEAASFGGKTDKQTA